MFRRFFIVLILVVSVVLEVQSKPGIKSGLKGCFKQKCPENTFACRRSSRISDDKKEIISEIQCLGLSDNVLQKTTSSEPNHFGPNVFFQGFTYTAAFEYTDDNAGNNNNQKKDVEKNIVEVDKDVDKIDRSTTFSELDDLNKPNVA